MTEDSFDDSLVDFFSPGNQLFRDFAGKVPDHGHPRSTQEMTGRKRLGLSGMEELLDIWSDHMLAVG